MCTRLYMICMCIIFVIVQPLPLPGPSATNAIFLDITPRRPNLYVKMTSSNSMTRTTIKNHTQYVDLLSVTSLLRAQEKQG